MHNAVPRNRSDIFIIRIADRSLPPGGEGVAPATDEGETGERNTKITSLSVKVLGILKTFFQEGFKRGSGRSPEVLPPLGL